MKWNKFVSVVLLFRVFEMACRVLCRRAGWSGCLAMRAVFCLSVVGVLFGGGFGRVLSCYASFLGDGCRFCIGVWSLALWYEFCLGIDCSLLLLLSRSLDVVWGCIVVSGCLLLVSLELLLLSLFLCGSRPLELSCLCLCGYGSVRGLDLSLWFALWFDAFPSRYALSLMFRMSASEYVFLCSFVLLLFLSLCLSFTYALFARA